MKTSSSANGIKGKNINHEVGDNVYNMQNKQQTSIQNTLKKNSSTSLRKRQTT